MLDTSLARPKKRRKEGQDRNTLTLQTDTTTKMSTSVPVTDILNLEKYPIHNITSPEAKELILQCQEQMIEDGSLLLEEFIRPEYVPAMAGQVCNLTTHRRLEIVDVMKKDPWVDKKYFKEENLRSLPNNHPLRFQMPQDVFAVASDLIPSDSLIRQVYDSTLVMDFLAAVVGQPEIHQYGDEFQALNIMYIKDGGNRAWHYDGSDYVVTLMLQVSVLSVLVLFFDCFLCFVFLSSYAFSCVSYLLANIMFILFFAFFFFFCTAE